VAVETELRPTLVDLADGRLFFDLNNETPAFGSFFARKADILEVAGIPKGVEVTLESGGIVNISRVGEDTSLDVSEGFCGCR